MRAPRLTVFVLAQVILLPTDAHAQDDTLLRAWEPAAVTELALPRAESSAPGTTGQRLTPDALQGPPTPAMLYAIASLDRDQLYREWKQRLAKGADEQGRLDGAPFPG